MFIFYTLEFTLYTQKSQYPCTFDDVLCIDTGFVLSYSVKISILVSSSPHLITEYRPDTVLSRVFCFCKNEVVTTFVTTF